MSEKVSLKIKRALCSAGAYTQTGIFPDWESWQHGAYEVFAGREGMNSKYGARYLMTMLEFSTEELNFLAASSLILSMTTSREEGESSNLGRISAILSNKELTATQIYYLQTEQNLMELAEKEGCFISYVNCFEYPQLGDWVLPNKKVSFVFDADSISFLKTGEKYYLFLKRRVGLPNKPNTEGEGGWSEFKNPFTYSSIELEYDDTPTWPSQEEIVITPSELQIYTGQNTEQQFSLFYKETGETFAHDTLIWSYKVFDTNGLIVEPVDWLIQSGSGLFTFQDTAPSGYTIQIIATWGSNSAIHEKISTIKVVSKWAHLKSWLYGYNLGLLCAPLVKFARQIIGYIFNLNAKETVILPKFPSFDSEKYPYSVVSQDQIIPTLFYLCISNNPFVYDVTEQRVNLQEGAEIEVFSCRPTTTFSWAASNDTSKTFYPFWANENLKDKNGIVRFNTYIPNPYYKQEDING